MSDVVVCVHVVPLLRKLRQEEREFKASLGSMVRPCLKKQKAKQNETKG